MSRGSAREQQHRSRAAALVQRCRNARTPHLCWSAAPLLGCCSFARTPRPCCSTASLLERCSFARGLRPRSNVNGMLGCLRGPRGLARCSGGDAADRRQQRGRWTMTGRSGIDQRPRLATADVPPALPLVVPGERSPVAKLWEPRRHGGNATPGPAPDLTGRGRQVGKIRDIGGGSPPAARQDREDVLDSIAMRGGDPLVGGIPGPGSARRGRRKAQRCPATVGAVSQARCWADRERRR